MVFRSVPAIVRGYIERALGYGTGYGSGGVSLSGKKVAVFQPQGGSKASSEKHIWPAMKTILGMNIFDYMGLQQLGFHYFPSVPYSSPEVRKGYLNEVEGFFNKLI